MQTEHYIVSSTEGHWRVTSDSGFEGLFRNRSAAIRAAIAAADAAGSSGEPAQVLRSTSKTASTWSDSTGMMRLLWPVPDHTNSGRP